MIVSNRKISIKNSAHKLIRIIMKILLNEIGNDQTYK